MPVLRQRHVARREGLRRLRRKLVASASLKPRPSWLALAGVLVHCQRTPPAPVELWIGGDVHLGDGSSRVFASLPRVLAGATGVVHLEGPVSSEAPAGGVDTRRLANAPAGFGALRAAGVRVVGIANNHDGDRGEDGPRETARALRAAGFAPTGGVAGAAVMELSGTRVVVTAHDLTRGVPAGLAEELARARRAGVLVATFHVTGQPRYLPRPELRAAVEIAVAAGARVVAAHGTHALGPVERRGETVIAYGLGNLAFACECTDEREGAVLRVALRGERTEAEIVPVEAGLRGRPARLSGDARGVLDLLVAIGSRGLGASGRF